MAYLSRSFFLRNVFFLVFCDFYIENIGKYDRVNNISGRSTAYLLNQIILNNMAKQNIGMEFAKNLAYFRKRKGFSQYDLAELSGISRRMIGHYEGEGIIPPADRLQALADSLDVPVYKLFKQPGMEASTETDLSGIDPRSVKKFRDILSLPAEDRNDLYRILNKMLRKNLLEKQRLEALNDRRKGV